MVTICLVHIRTEILYNWIKYVRNFTLTYSEIFLSIQLDKSLKKSVSKQFPTNTDSCLHATVSTDLNSSLL